MVASQLPWGSFFSMLPHPPGRQSAQEALGKHLASNGNATKAGGGLELNPSRSTGIHLFTEQTRHCNKYILSVYYAPAAILLQAEAAKMRQSFTLEEFTRGQSDWGKRYSYKQ